MVDAESPQEFLWTFCIGHDFQKKNCGRFASLTDLSESPHCGRFDLWMICYVTKSNARQSLLVSAVYKAVP
jgi:hypothetical protein